MDKSSLIMTKQRKTRQHIPEKITQAVILLLETSKISQQDIAKLYNISISSIEKIAMDYN